MKPVFDHEEMRVYQLAIKFVAWHDEVASHISSKLSACDHLSRASAGIPVNIAQASGKRSMNDRRQFIDTAFGSALECAACLDVPGVLGSLKTTNIQTGKAHLSMLVSMLIGYRKSAEREVREERATYATNGHDNGPVWFDHEKLDVYRKALEFVAFCSQFMNSSSILRSTIIALDRTSTGIALNIAEGNGKFSTKNRCRFIGHARTAALQAAATMDVLAMRQANDKLTLLEGKNQLANIVRMLVAWERNLNDK